MIAAQQATQYRSTWRSAEREEMARFLKRYVLSGHRVVGIGRIEVALADRRPAFMETFSQSDSQRHRLISHAMRDLRWRANTWGRYGRISSWVQD